MHHWLKGSKMFHHKGEPGLKGGWPSKTDKLSLPWVKFVPSHSFHSAGALNDEQMEREQGVSNDQPTPEPQHIYPHFGSQCQHSSGQLTNHPNTRRKEEGREHHQGQRLFSVPKGLDNVPFQWTDNCCMLYQLIKNFTMGSGMFLLITEASGLATIYIKGLRSIN